MLMFFSFLCICQISSSFLNSPSSLCVPHPSSSRISKECKIGTLFAGGGFGGGGSSQSKSKRKGKKGKNVSSSSSPSSSGLSTKKKLQMKERLLKSYGGDIARGTTERIQKSMSELPPHIQEIIPLYQKVKRWDASMASLSVSQQLQVPERDIEGAKRGRAELESFYEQYDIDAQYMHNIFQKNTWDASADAKAVKASIGTMPAHILERVDKACGIIADSVKRSGRKEGRCLDVGCGHGTLIPNLTKAGVYANQITGIDLSPEMIRNAKERYRGPNFQAIDFLQFDAKDDEYDGIIFCSALHDLPDMKSSLSKASSLLRPEGKIVIVHAQGGGHVISQVKANPVLVNRGLPDKDELKQWAEEMMLDLEISPVDALTKEDEEEGYLAVLKKKTL